MATISSTRRLDVVLDAGRTIFQQKRDQMTQALATRKVYRKTFFELSTLTDRDLQDLGISRSNIKRIAMEAAYDC